MAIKHGFFDSDWNKEGRGLPHQYEALNIRGDKIILDRASRIMWQQSGSPVTMTYEIAKEWIQELNQKGFAGYRDWRLPTLEEAMSLMETEKKNGDLHIDPVFAKEQWRIWTSDQVKRVSWAWVVLFNVGYCYGGRFYSGDYCVRGVRSGQSSNR